MTDENLQDYTHLASGYDSGRYDSDSDRFRESLREEAFLEIARPGPGDRVLDVGSGTGSGVLFFAPRVASVVALDGTQAMLDVAQEKADRHGISNVEFVCANALEIPYDDASFDLVVSLNFVHLFVPKGLELQGRFVAEMGRVVKPGGAVVVEYDNVRHAPELGNRYADLPRIGGLHMESVIGTYMPKTAAARRLGAGLAGTYGRLARKPFFRRHAYRWLARYVKA